MAQYEFWATMSPKIPKYYELVEIPDEKFIGLDDKQKERLLLDEHTKWILRKVYGDWEKS